MSTLGTRLRRSARPPAESTGGATPAGGAPTAIRLRQVTKRFGRAAKGGVTALEDLDLDVAEGEFVCLVGASGCGKSTLLNLIAGLDKPTAGTIDTGGRSVSFMFQDATLFPWLTAGQNVELALRLRGVPANERKRRAAELLELVHLGGRDDLRPHELSGGMRQRTQLARVLAQETDIVLMDEPFAALDAMTRDAMHDELERIRADLELTVVFVTHNVREAVRLADRTVLLTSGPGRVKTVVDVDLPRPRHQDDPDVARLAGRLTAELRSEMAAHVR